MPDRSSGRPQGRPSPDLIFADPAWRRSLPRLRHLATRAVAAAGAADTIVFTSDREVKTLNHAHRGQNKPTNVLSFEPLSPGSAGELVLAYGTIKREAAAAQKPLAHHLAHLLVHGTLHLAGADHRSAAEARRMEQREARILRGLGIPNPWKPRPHAARPKA